MEENKNTKTAAAAEATVNSIKKLLDTVGHDDDLKQKLEDILAALTGKRSDAAETKETPEKKEVPSAAAGEEDSADEDDDDDDVEFSSGSDLSDIFTEDALAGMVVGFVAGAAVVGGGVLIHKLISK